ncbi:hypothetical protein V3589_02460 [Sinorhizobium fredii]|uniref:hypothetical protein n=1 Tax=Rhizobium fredii TaxID=380 RepID=UPI0030AB1655
MSVVFAQADDSARARHALLAAIVIVSATIIGLWIRWQLREHTTSDTFKYLLPWYELAKSGGVDSLRQGLTNYAPFYSYLLLLATWFDGVLPPLFLIKAISFVFEFGCALLGYSLVAAGLRNGRPLLPALAFAAIWLAPNALYNGAMWGQADAIWTFFVLLSIYLICRKSYRWAVLAFGMAVSVKLQAVFLGPLIFALVLQRRLHWAWLGAIPAVYLVVALPTIALGRPLLDVLAIYLRQAEFFSALSMGAANLWLFVPNQFYGPGVAVGLALGAAAGLAFSIYAARQQDWSPAFIVLAAAVALQLMPWILPKMHDRYFYAFETTAILLAFLEPRLALVAIMAQVNAVLSYLSFDFRRGLPMLGTPLAALLNTLTLGFVVRRFVAGPFSAFAFTVSATAIVLAYCLWLTGLAATTAPAEISTWWPVNKTDVAGLAVYLVVMLGVTVIVATPFALRRRRHTPVSAPIE